MLYSCPKCKSGNLTVHEHFSVSSAIHLSDGEVDRTHGADGNGHSLGKFSGVCDDCEHRWWLKFDTGQKIIEAAAQFDFPDFPEHK